MNDAECHDDLPSSLNNLVTSAGLTWIVFVERVNLLHFRVETWHETASPSQLDFGPVRQNDGMDVGVGGWLDFPICGYLNLRNREDIILDRLGGREGRCGSEVGFAGSGNWQRRHVNVQIYYEAQGHASSRN